MKIMPSHMVITKQELAQEQQGANTHLTFLLTLACPLKCAHCIVDAGPNKGHTTMPLEVAQWYASQMPEMYEHGIRLLSLTGGEPFLARKQLHVMSEGGAAAGMTCGVVTAAHWAHSPKRAVALVKAFPHLHLWDISLDSYHLEYLPVERVRTAYEAAKECGRRAVLRFTFHEPLTDKDKEVMEMLDSFADPDDILSSRLRHVGRASWRPAFETTTNATLIKPCLTKGLVVRYDGSTAPCCVNLVEERRHPFHFGDPRTRRLKDLHKDYMTDPLMQMIRILGFGEVIEWLKRAGMEHILPDPMPEDVCDLCPHIMTNQIAAGIVQSLCNEPETKLKLAVLSDRILGEPEMLHRAVEELKPVSESIAGFDAAEQLAKDTPRERRAIGDTHALA